MRTMLIVKATLIAAWTIGAIGIARAEAVRNPDPVPSASPRASKDECVFVNSISSWHVLDSSNVVLFTNAANRAYLMQLSPPVSDLKFAFKVAFIDRDRDGQLCGRSLDKVQAAGSLVRQPATIMAMTRLDEAGLQRLEAQYNVKLTGKKDRKTTAEQPQATG